MKPNSWCVARAHRTILALLLFSLLPTSLLAEPVTLKHAVELALKHAVAADIAAGDEQRAQAGYRQLSASYIPQVTAGAGLGYSYGFPLSLEGAAPSLFNFTAQSALIHPELRSFMKAAQADSSAASFRSKDQRNQIIQDTVLSYAELQKWEERLARLHEVESDAEKMQAAVSDRVKEGVDSEIDATKARLSLARTRLRVAEAQGAGDVLRERLSKLTGLPAEGIQTEPDSIPARPEATPASATSNSNSVESNPGVQAAVEHARAQFLRAQGEHRTLWPTADFATQYAVLSRFNHYQDYFQPGSFKRNNASIGVVLRFPFLNASQRARAEGADAEALIAKKQSEAVRDQVSEATLRLQRSVTQMQAAHDVAELEYELAQKNLDAVQTRTDSGNATLHDLDDARTQASERFIALQDVSFELERLQVELLRSTGDLEKWALGTP